MSKADVIKEHIGWLKVVFGTLVVADLSTVAWLGQNFDSTVWYKSAVAMIAALILSYAIYWVNKKAFRKMKQLEKL
jgi:hypothetical protein